ncbi:MAG: hypothetical protein RLZZ01_1184 [Actinomycetota bacterium]|jgi:mycofactocin precursor
MDLEPTDLADTSDSDHSDVADQGELADELLIEEISIDGMCGVY